jgi:hypothetical protein
MTGFRFYPAAMRWYDGDSFIHSGCGTGSVSDLDLGK